MNIRWQEINIHGFIHSWGSALRVQEWLANMNRWLFFAETSYSQEWAKNHWFLILHHATIHLNKSTLISIKLYKMYINHVIILKYQNHWTSFIALWSFYWHAALKHLCIIYICIIVKMFCMCVCSKDMSSILVWRRYSSILPAFCFCCSPLPPAFSFCGATWTWCNGIWRQARLLWCWLMGKLTISSQAPA